MEEDSAIRPAGQLLKREESIRKFFRLKAGAPDDDRVAQFADYFETTWLNVHYHTYIQVYNFLNPTQN